MTSRRLVTFIAAAIAGVFALVSAPGLRAETADVGTPPPRDAAKPPEPAEYRMDEYRKPVPATLKGASVLTSEKAGELWTKKEAVFIDVYPRAPKPPNLPKGTFWREPVHHSIENATWLANVGYGVLSPAVDEYFKTHLETLTGGDKAKAIVFYCLRDCWMSWNAAKRALTYGYTNVMWYPDGTDGWQEIGLPVTEVKPAP